MILRSDPTHPSARAILGDYAVRQNQQDRSQPMLNEVIDQTFKPVHDLWKRQWQMQQEAEAALNTARTARHEAVQALNDSIRQVLRSVLYSQGGNAPLIQTYLPGGNLDVLYHPAARQLLELEPYVQAVSRAPDEVIPASVRDDFAARYAEAQLAHSRVESATRAAIEAQRERMAMDQRWVDAFNAFHRAVEYVAFKERTSVRDWVREWMTAASRPTLSSSRRADSHTRP